jgi:hypothetical protein
MHTNCTWLDMEPIRWRIYLRVNKSAAFPLQSTVKKDVMYMIYKWILVIVDLDPKVLWRETEDSRETKFGGKNESQFSAKIYKLIRRQRVVCVKTESIRRWSEGRRRLVFKLQGGSFHSSPGMPDFSSYNIPKRGKNISKTFQYTKWP